MWVDDSVSLPGDSFLCKFNSHCRFVLVLEGSPKVPLGKMADETAKFEIRSKGFRSSLYGNLLLHHDGFQLLKHLPKHSA